MEGNKKLSNGSREMSPCKGCDERFTACSGRCPKDARGEYGYNAWIDNLRKVAANRKAYYANRRKKW